MRLAHRIRPLIVGLALAFAVGCGGAETLGPPTGPPPTVDGDRAMTLVQEQVAIGPRVAGTEGAQKTAEYIAKTARGYGYEDVQIDAWTETTPAGKVTFRNVLVRVPGEGDEYIVVGSHYDTKRLAGAPDFAGANDAASSTAALLEMLRAIQAHGKWQGMPIIFAFFDGEEAHTRYTDNDGLHGSKRLAGQLATQGDISKCRAMVLLDMIGDSDLMVTMPPNSDVALKKQVLAIAKKQGVAKHFGHYTYGAILDDHVPFMERGVPAVDLIDFNYGPRNSYWHTDQDTIEHVSGESIAIVANVALELLWQLR